MNEFFFSHLSIEINELFTNEYTKLVMGLDFLKVKKKKHRRKKNFGFFVSVIFSSENPKFSTLSKPITYHFLGRTVHPQNNHIYFHLCTTLKITIQWIPSHCFFY